ncbi:MAG: phosphoribosylamine--glycine ligase [Oscillospiraceae bacterium]|nr:phosphoribosylamine--glycine ligase [Oscillospiraceae bacterium]
MKVLVVGGGGREHTIVKKISVSPNVDHIWCAPGNGGIASLAECVDIKATDLPAITAFCLEHRPDLVMVAPDDPLVLGLVDALEELGIRAFGPRANAAIVEGSKSFAKKFMQENNIPTASYAVFTDADAAIAYVKEQGAPIVIKADGLALGKGVTVAMTEADAIDAIKNAMCDGAFGDAGSRVVIEEFLTGPEVSVLCFTDGETIVPMPSAQDHKRAFDHDEGPNTGGMGAFSPSRYYTADLAKECMETIFRPTVDGLTKAGRRFQGVLYFGLMLTPNGPKVIEYNARFGDPETQAVLPLLETDFVTVMEAIIDRKLADIEVKFSDNAACCVVLASGGYPGKYTTGYEISGIADADALDGVTVYHAGTKKTESGVATAGGRVLGVTARGEDLDAAIKNAYAATELISFTDLHKRTDIGIK